MVAGKCSLSLGELGLVQELQLANSNLQWRLSQRNKVLASSQESIQQLRQRVQSQQREIAALREELESKERDTVRRTMVLITYQGIY